MWCSLRALLSAPSSPSHSLSNLHSLLTVGSTTVCAQWGEPAVVQPTPGRWQAESHTGAQHDPPRPPSIPLTSMYTSPNAPPLLGSPYHTRLLLSMRPNGRERLHSCTPKHATRCRWHRSLKKIQLGTVAVAVIRERECMYVTQAHRDTHICMFAKHPTSSVVERCKARSKSTCSELKC